MKGIENEVRADKVFGKELLLGELRWGYEFAPESPPEMTQVIAGVDAGLQETDEKLELLRTLKCWP